MAGIWDKQPWPSPPLFGRVSSPRVFSRRTFMLLFLLFTLGMLLLSARRNGQLCQDGQYCGISRIRDKLPTLGNNGGPSSDKTADANLLSPSASASASSPPSASASGSGTQAQPSSSTLDDSECANFPNTTSVLTIMKTGASEAYSKIPTQLMTNLKCLPDYLLFSDMSQKIAGYTIHDCLDTVLDKVKQDSKDFELYHRQQKCPVDQDLCNKVHDTAKQGWELDKYKNIHMAEKAYAMRPNYDWYLFVDADTYVAYPTLTEWLKHLDPSKRNYIGSVAMLGSLLFGHGGSGYLLSKATMQAMFGGRTNVANKFDEQAQHICCGDALLAQALKDEAGIEVINAWPTINGEKPHTLPYAEDGWCHPISTMHHVVAQDISDLYAFEKERKFAQPLRIKDLYHKFMEPHLLEDRADWDNLSDDTVYLNTSMAKYDEWEINRAKKDGLSNEEAQAHKSFEDCKKACQSIDDCLQFRYQNYICRTSRKLKHGKPSAKENEEFKRFLSGWNVERIKAWIDKQGDCSGPVKWPLAE